MLIFAIDKRLRLCEHYEQLHPLLQERDGGTDSLWTDTVANGGAVTLAALERPQAVPSDRNALPGAEDGDDEDEDLPADLEALLQAEDTGDAGPEDTQEGEDVDETGTTSGSTGRPTLRPNQAGKSSGTLSWVPRNQV